MLELVLSPFRSILRASESKCHRIRCGNVIVLGSAVSVEPPRNIFALQNQHRNALELVVEIRLRRVFVVRILLIGCVCCVIRRAHAQSNVKEMIQKEVQRVHGSFVEVHLRVRHGRIVLLVLVVSARERALCDVTLALELLLPV